MKANENILQEIKKAVLSVDEKAEVILFGSRARGDCDEESDWDVLILVDAEEDDFIFKQRIRNVLFDLELKTNTVISSIVRNKDFWEDISITPLYREVERDGIHL